MNRTIYPVNDAKCMCVDLYAPRYCPRHLPAEYAMFDAKHRAEVPTDSERAA